MKNILIIFSFLLFGCHEIHEGTITDKRIIPSHDDLVYQPLCLPDGNGGVQLYPNWTNIHYNEVYQILVSNDSVSEWFEVNRDSYENLEKGRFVQFGGFK